MTARPHNVYALSEKFSDLFGDPSNETEPQQDLGPWAESRWVDRLHVGFLVRWILGLPPKETRRYRKILGTQIEDARDSAPHGLTTFLRSLPLSSLHGLAYAADDRGGRVLQSIRHDIQDALSFLTETDAGDFKRQAAQPSRIESVRIWTTHAMLGGSSADRLLRLGDRKEFFGFRWRELRRSGTAHGALSAALLALRSIDPLNDTTIRTLRIGELAAALMPAPAWARHQIENELMHHQFVWPLLILDGVPCSIPVGVDFTIAPVASRPPEPWGGEHSRVVGREGPLATEGWTAQLDHAARVAKDVWRAKNGNAGPFRDVARNDGLITYDFSWAQDIVSVLGTTERYPLEDHSADAYLAQAALARILGTTVFNPAAAVGGIGDPLPGNDGKPMLDYGLTSPRDAEELEAKLAFASQHGGYRETVMSTEAEPLVRKDGPGRPEFVRSVQRMADRFQTGTWRQYSYSRAPEIQWAVHTGKASRYVETLRPATSPSVQAVFDALSRSTASSLVHVEATPLDVGSALWHANTVVRESFVPNLDPSLSWAFVRVMEGESDEQFWTQALRACGLRPAEVQQALLLDHEAFVARVANVFNTLELSEGARNLRAPDILVVLGGGALRENAAYGTTTSRPLLAPPVLRALAGRLRPVNQRALHGILGASRIVVVEDPERSTPWPDRSKLDALSDSDISLLSVLSTFRFGFTLEQAAFVYERHPATSRQARDDRTPLRDRLNSLVHDRRALRFISGTYDLYPGVRSGLPRPASPYDNAVSHYAAAWALAPYVRGQNGLKIETSEIFDSESRWEAEAHLELARADAEAAVVHAHRFRRSAIGRSEALQSAIFQALQKLHTYAEAPTWQGVVRHLRTNSGFYGASLAERLIEARGPALDRLHPVHLALAARAHHSSLGTLNPDDTECTRSRVRDLYAAALENLEWLPTDERAAAEVSVRSYYGEMFGYDDRDAIGREAGVLLDLTDRFEPQSSPLYLPHVRIFSKAGDFLADDALAHRMYGAGARVRPQFFYNAVKALGTAHPDHAWAFARGVWDRTDCVRQLDRLLDDLERVRKWGDKSAIWRNWMAPDKPVRTKDRIVRGLDRLAGYNGCSKVKERARHAANAMHVL